MKKNRVTAFILLWLPILSSACSLFIKAPTATPTPEMIFEPVTTPLVIEPPALPAAQAGVMYEVELHITQNVTPVSDMLIKDGAPPDGLEFVFLEGEDAATISGIPQETGSFHITVTVWCFGTMVSGQTLEKEYEIIVNQ
ncbi:MAG: hypothetical protein H6667_14685 [Ardenticatenaceae bacterium]|nr:hypothetical protein [Ardenticatenaceae bacterium]MCB9445509.1 hypothetical protein [Ardenticatenaceae bacterium]